jgi:hypothetical protein
MRLPIVLLACLFALPASAGDIEDIRPIVGRWTTSLASCDPKNEINDVLTITDKYITQGEWHCVVKGGIRTQTKWVARVECAYEESSPVLSQIELESANGVLHMIFAPFTNSRKEEYFAFKCDR